jgi:hypothetical protein
MNIDYSVCQALNYHTKNLPGAIEYYDIGCQWFNNFLKRVLEGPFLHLPEGMTHIAAVGKFHLNAHTRNALQSTLLTSSRELDRWMEKSLRLSGLCST